jgi:hypothetical protein
MDSNSKRKWIDLLGAVGVVASLVFVGLEVRQNTLISRGAAVQSITEQVNDWQIEMASNDDWIRISVFLDDGGTYADLSTEDQMRYRYVVTPTIRIMENRYRQVRFGIIDPSELEVGGGKANTYWYRSAHFIEFWQAGEMKIRWTPDFIDFMEEEVMAIL